MKWRPRLTSIQMPSKESPRIPYPSQSSSVILAHSQLWSMTTGENSGAILMLLHSKTIPDPETELLNFLLKRNSIVSRKRLRHNPRKLWNSTKNADQKYGDSSTITELLYNELQFTKWIEKVGKMERIFRQLEDKT